MRVLPVFLLLMAIFFASCEKNTVSKIPQISLLYSGPDSMRVNIDTFFIVFSLVDGDADLGNSAESAIYFKDSRSDSSSFIKADFPEINPDIEDPNKGLEGTCTFVPLPGPEPRLDSVHLTTGDTLTYELYIKDRAGNESNHITTRRLIVRP